MATFPDDCIPPEGFFESRKALFESINLYAKPQGYAFITRRSTWEKNGHLSVVFACDHSRQLPSEGTSRRQTTTRMTEYPFSVLAKESSEGWTLKYRHDVLHTSHNHELSLHPSAHPVHGQLSRTPQLESLSNAGLVPKEIQTIIQQSGSLATCQDIYNRIVEVRQDARQGQSLIHTLMNQLEQEGFWSRIQLASDGYVTTVLFAHPDYLLYL